MSKGKLIAVGNPEELKHKAMRGDCLDVLCSDAQAAKPLLEKDPQVFSAVIQGSWLRLVVEDYGSTIPTVISTLSTAGLTVYDVKISQLTLEDVFLNLVQRGDTAETRPTLLDYYEGIPSDSTKQKSRPDLAADASFSHDFGRVCFQRRDKTRSARHC